MTKKSDYTKDEWALLCQGPGLAGVGVSLLDPGIVSSHKELSAIARATHDGKDRYAGDELVLSVLADLEAQGDLDVPHDDGLTAEGVLERLQKIDAILDAKAGEENGNGYRNWLYQVADTAANAAGGFLGLGEKVSDAESTYLAKVKDILFREPSTPAASAD